MEYSIEKNWREPEPGTGKYIRKGDPRLLRLTAGCPCSGCDWYANCRATGHECKIFERWVKTGKLNEAKR